MSKTTIAFELEFLDKKLKEMEKYIESRPLDKLEDRIVEKKVVATIEKQREDIFKSIDEYAKILEKVEKLREVSQQEEVKKRGGGALSLVERRMAQNKNRN